MSELTQFQKDVGSGTLVFWNDPDNGLSSGWYTVIVVLHDHDGERHDDTLVVLKNDSGSEAEVYLEEISDMPPPQMGLASNTL